MKKFLLNITTLMLILVLLVGCARSQGEQPSAPATDATTASTVESTQAPTEEDVVEEVEASTHYMKNVYPKQIDRYYTAISQQWDENTCMDNEMSALVARYYEGNPLDNVGFTFMDLDGDGIWELIIGAILDGEQDPLVFEIWALKNDEPVMIAQSGYHNRYYLQYHQEDNRWTVAYEAENGAANRAVYYLQLVNGEFQVIQGVIFDAVADENAPWFETTDLDWKVSNDSPIDEQTAVKMMNAGRDLYAPTEYFPYCLYK